MIWEGRTLNREDSLLHENAPKTPDNVAITFISATAGAAMCNSVLAKSTAVPLTVAMPSLSKNHAAKKRITSFKCRARSTVLPSDCHAYMTYPVQLRTCFPSLVNARGGPGRGRSHIAAGMVNNIHHSPTTKRTIRSARLFERLTYLIPRIIRIPRVSTTTPAM